MIRIYKYNDSNIYFDFESYLFNNSERIIIFDYLNDKVTIDNEIYRISTMDFIRDSESPEKYIEEIRNFLYTILNLFNPNGSLNVITTNVVSSTGGQIQNNDIDVVAEQICTDSHPCKFCIVQSDFDNTDKLWIGMDNSVSENNGILLFPTDSIRLEVSNTNLLYAYASSINQGVSITYFN